MLLKNTLRKMHKSFGRYISIFLIIFIGIGFYAGVKASPDSISVAANSYFNDSQLMDFKIVSTAGLTSGDVVALEGIDGVQRVIPSYSTDIVIDSAVTRIHSLEDGINSPTIIDGRMPKAANEVLADAKTHKVGDTMTIDEGIDELQVATMTVVGVAQSPLYPSTSYGSSTAGNGQLDSFIFVPRDALRLDAYSEIYVLLNDSKGDPYTDAYAKTVAHVKADIQKIQKQRQDVRYTELAARAKDAILREQPILAQHTDQIDSALGAIDTPKPQWTILDRSFIAGYESLSSDIESVRIIAAIIPLLFIALVALMTSTTMGRMISEERGEMGTLAALGYGNPQIIGAYLFYVLSATLLGATLGFIAGTLFIPPLIFEAFPYELPDIQPFFSPIVLAVIIAASTVLMSMITIQACRNELRQAPARLLRPLAPKPGKRVLLEHVPFIWKRLSFNWKVTMRNIFRYKKRVFMTVVGIASCTSLLVLGFGIQDSIEGVGAKQYEEIFTYDSQLALRGETNGLSGDDQTYLRDRGLDNPLLIRQSPYDAEGNDMSLSVYLVTPEDDDSLGRHINLYDWQTNEPLSLSSSRVIATQKIAKLFDVGVGDTIVIRSDGERYELQVGAIAQNYLENYLYISSEAYRATIDDSLSFNTIIANTFGDPNDIAESLIEDNYAVAVNHTEDIEKEAETMIKGLDNIVLLIIVIAATLSLVVLYNLTSINISERTREIATLKVLGFTDKENNQYVYRESFTLTLISIILGLGLGILLHRVVIPIIENDSLEMIKTVRWQSLVYTFVLSVIFALIVQIFTHFKLKKIDMIGALKSSE